MNILVLEASQTSLLILQTHLMREEKHEIYTFRDPVEALQSIFLEKSVPMPNIFLLEVANLPRMKGYDVIRQFRKYAGKEVPVIVISKWGGVFEHLLARLAGATTYLDKPIVKEKFLELVRSFDR